MCAREPEPAQWIHVVHAARMTKRALWLVGAVTLLIGLILLPTAWLDMERFKVWISIVQAVGLIMALTFTTLTFRRDSKDRRVDRVLALHAELMSDPVASARRRLVRLIRSRTKDGKVLRLSRDELRTNPEYKIYSFSSDNHPFEDSSIVLRFFERATAALAADAVYKPLFVELLGRHATWWDIALEPEGVSVPRKPLEDLARWSNEFTREHARAFPYLEGWGVNRERDFGPNLTEEMSPDI